MESLKEELRNEQPDATSRCPEDLTPQSLVVLVGCSDGKLRVVAFEGKMAKQVHGYVRHIQGGHLKLSKEPVALLMEDAADELFALKDKVNSETTKPGWFSRHWSLITGHSSSCSK